MLHVLRALVVLGVACTGRALALPMQGDSLYLADLLALVAVNDERIGLQKARGEQVRGEAIAAAAFLDPSLRLEAEMSRSGRHVAGPAATPAWTIAYSASVAQSTSWGVTVAPYVTISAAPELTGAPSSVGLELSVPLLRLGTRNPESALLRATQLRLIASEHRTRHVRVEALFAAAVAYWELRAGHDRLDILRTAERRATEVVGIIARVVEVGERPAADLTQAEAFAADRMRERSGAEQQLRVHAARVAELTSIALDEVMGVVPAREATSEVVAGGAGRVSAPAIQLDDRDDLMALRTQLLADRLLARNRIADMLPNLRLFARLGEAHGISGDPFDGPFASLSVALTGNVYRRLARSSLMVQRAIEREQRLAFEHGLRRARISLAVAGAAVQNARLELNAARDALAAHERAVWNVRQTLEAGLVTMFDVILAEDRLTNARLAVAGAEARLGQAVARLAVERGDLSGGGPMTAKEWAARLLGVREPRP